MKKIIPLWKYTTNSICWLPIILTCMLMSYQVTDIQGGTIRRRFNEWRARCREKFQSGRVIYKMWSKLKDNESLDPTDEEFHPLRDKVDQFMKIDTETIVKGFDTFRKSGGFKNQAIGKMFDVCSRQMGNTSNMISEMKKHLQYIQKINDQKKI